MLAVAIAQGGFYVATGLWAIVHIGSFQKVTGPKTDIWLVKTVGLLLVAIGAGLLLAAYRQQFDPALILIAVGAAAALILERRLPADLAPLEEDLAPARLRR